MIYLSIIYSFFPWIIKLAKQNYVKINGNNIKPKDNIELQNNEDTVTNDQILYEYYSNKIKKNKEARV